MILGDNCHYRICQNIKNLEIIEKFLFTFYILIELIIAYMRVRSSNFIILLLYMLYMNTVIYEYMKTKNNRALFINIFVTDSTPIHSGNKYM